MPATHFPFGVTCYRPDKAHGTYVLFDGRDGRSYLVDMNGNDAKVWPHTGFPVEMIDPALNGGRRGHVLCQKEPETFFNETLLELDWDGRAVWEWGPQAPGGKARQNHDLARLANGHTLILSKIERSRVDLTSEPFLDQPIYEVTPKGEIVWTWIPSDHLDELGFTARTRDILFAASTRKRPYIFVINDMAPLGPNRWHDAGDPRFHPDNIMIDSREANFMAIIEKRTGAVVWRVGPDYPAAHDFSKRAFTGPVPRPIDMLSGQHDAHMIAAGLPGAGNILVFDNNGPAGMPPTWLQTFPASRVLEIDPIRKEIVWQYDASCSGRPFWTFYSSFISSARRLPNGNTLIDEGMHGRIFQVTPDGEIVWEYVNPHHGEWTQHLIQFGGRVSNWIFRAQPVPYDWVPDGTKREEREVIPPRLPAGGVP